ncbi:MAG: L-lactate dehydrogenase [Eubacteriales bacterium]|nr:L-lactate dehydrogenase [Eubacteriales bacterium]
MGIHKTKIGIVGVGHVGAHCAYSLLIQGLADELVLVDINEKKLESEVQDLRDSVVYTPHNCTITAGTYEDLADCNIIVNAVGNIGLIAAGDRVLETEFTIQAVNGYVKKVVEAGFDGIWINITNPCDIVTRQIALLSGLPKGHVFGTGTGLDTSRLKAILAKETGYDPKSFDGYVLGEHGKKQTVPWSTITFGGKSIAELVKSDDKFQFDLDDAAKKVHDNAWVTYNGKGCTEYGICSTLARIVKAVIHDEKVILPTSAPLDGEYGIHDIYVGVPAVVGKDGIEKVVELPLNAEEQKAFEECCEGVRQNIRDAKEKGIDVII